MAAAADAEFVSEPIGCHPFGPPCGLELRWWLGNQCLDLTNPFITSGIIRVEEVSVCPQSLEHGKFVLHRR